jgi:hypothetical protein
VRERIEAGLSGADAWYVLSFRSRPVAEEERELAVALWRAQIPRLTPYPRLRAPVAQLDRAAAF